MKFKKVEKYFLKKILFFRMTMLHVTDLQQLRYIAEKASFKTIWWPSQSPDLNPIENMWCFLKKKVAKYRPQNKKELIKIIKNVWEKEIPSTLTMNLAMSMNRRIQEVIKAKRGHINY